MPYTYIALFLTQSRFFLFFFYKRGSKFSAGLVFRPQSQPLLRLLDPVVLSMNHPQVSPGWNISFLPFVILTNRHRSAAV